jgi:hypothetical protein
MSDNAIRVLTKEYQKCRFFGAHRIKKGLSATLDAITSKINVSSQTQSALKIILHEAEK